MSTTLDFIFRSGRRVLVGGFVLFALFLLFVLGRPFYSSYTKKDVWIYVDNGGPNTLDVSLDGAHEGSVPPGESRIVKCQSGERRITVREGQAILSDEVKLLKNPARDKVTKYLLNPRQDRLYWTYLAEYGNPAFEKGWKEFKERMGGAKKPSLPSSTERYRELVQLPKLVERQPWLELENYYYVLERPSDEVQGKRI